jgi:hypothetical protein
MSLKINNRFAHDIPRILASAFGFLLILIGSFLLVLGFQNILQCSNLFPNDNCWDVFHVPYRSGYDFRTFVIGFYAGAILAIIGTVLLLGGDVVRLMRKLTGGGI